MRWENRQWIKGECSAIRFMAAVYFLELQLKEIAVNVCATWGWNYSVKQTPSREEWKIDLHLGPLEMCDALEKVFSHLHNSYLMLGLCTLLQGSLCPCVK